MHQTLSMKIMPARSLQIAPCVSANSTHMTIIILLTWNPLFWQRGKIILNLTFIQVLIEFHGFISDINRANYICLAYFFIFFRFFLVVLILYILVFIINVKDRRLRLMILLNHLWINLRWIIHIDDYLIYI